MTNERMTNEVLVHSSFVICHSGIIVIVPPGSRDTAVIPLQLVAVPVRHRAAETFAHVALAVVFLDALLQCTRSQPETAQRLVELTLR
jgi:hypothetical protein